MAENDEPSRDEGRPASPVPLYRDLPFRGRMLRAAGIAFTIYHLGAVLAGGAVAGVRKFFDPVLGFYADGLRMTNSWGMFGKPPNTTHVVIEVDTKTERNIVVATTRAQGKPLFDRIRDTRIRKLQGKLSDEGDRNRFGQPFLDFFCKHPPPGHADVKVVRAINELHELRDDDGKVTREASTKVLFTRRCAGTAPSKSWLPPPPPTAAPPSGEGDL